MRRDAAGFTLVEVLVTTLLLAAGALGFLQATLVAERLRERARTMAEAALLAEGGVERVAALGWELATADLARETHPALLGTGAAAPAARVRGRGADYLVLYERVEDGAGPPRCTVRCFWAAQGAPFEARNAVALATRPR